MARDGAKRQGHKVPYVVACENYVKKDCALLSKLGANFHYEQR